MLKALSQKKTDAECVMLGIYIDLASTLSMYMSWFGHILILTLEHGRRHSHTLFVSRLYNKIGGSGLSQNFVILYLLTNKSNTFPPPLLIAFKLPSTGNTECVMCTHR